MQVGGWYIKEPSVGTPTEVLVRALALAEQVRQWSPHGDQWRRVTAAMAAVSDQLTTDGILPSCPSTLRRGPVRNLVEETNGAMAKHAAVIGAAVGKWKHTPCVGRALSALDVAAYARAPLLAPLRDEGHGVKTTPRWLALAPKVVDLVDSQRHALLRALSVAAGREDAPEATATAALEAEPLMLDAAMAEIAKLREALAKQEAEAQKEATAAARKVERLDKKLAAAVGAQKAAEDRLNDTVAEAVAKAKTQQEQSCEKLAARIARYCDKR